MNTRALMELVAVNIGLDLGIIPSDMFFMLVMMAVLTTFLAAPILRRLVLRSELQAPFLQSEFMNERGTAVGARARFIIAEQ
jgi:hypothetical protein